MQVRKSKEKMLYRRHLEFSLVIVLFALIFVFQGWKQFDSKTAPPPPPTIPPVVVVDVVRTVQPDKVPPPSRPVMPEPTDDPLVPDNVTIPETGSFFTEIKEPPLPPDVSNEPVPFISVDVKPQPIGGYAAFVRNLVYPEIARKAGVEGQVIVKCLLDEQGNVIRAEIVKSLGNNGCDEAALAAVRTVKWTPAMQRDQAVRVWVNIPIMFKLR